MSKINGGVYRIEIAEFYYIGRTKDFKRRWKQHLADLTNKKHTNKKMQQAFDEFQVFEPFVVKRIEGVEAQAELEQELIDEHIGKEFCLNINDSAYGFPRNGNYKGGRPKKTTTVMKEAVNDKNVEALLWAFLNHSVAELRDEGGLKSFSGNHIISMLDQLIKLQDNKPKDDNNEKEIEGLKEWLKQAS
jgi:hypothetical protein